ncbi:MAG: single-stranded-DNA-specific exonuclease RecJ [Spirochaetaceae bacterium]|jgi:single-stranded-DNA-specific exonuclease|nr:single-stranded-DNA-specific exonuclease RecJ [Spirochaetaceae bacterium]
MRWEKKDAPTELVKEISKKYSCDLLTASILVRRGVTEGKKLAYYMEEDRRYLRIPFELRGMEDAVERILVAKEEGEKVLVFGDRDADGVTSLAIVAGLLRRLGVDVSWRVPQGEDPYGLTIGVIDEFAKQMGTLIITVDCGISNHKEIDHANELNIDVIVTDHHRQQETLPNALAIIDPKLKEDDVYLYPFPDLAGCGVAYKLAQALRFAIKSTYYNQTICLLNAMPANDDAWTIEILKIRNLVIVDKLTETIVPGMAGINDTRLPAFLAGQVILVWDEPVQKKSLEKIFGAGVEFGLVDICGEISKVIPKTAGSSLLRLREASRIARYAQYGASEIYVLYNLFVSYVQINDKLFGAEDDDDMQLAAVGTIADLMPLEDENRILVRTGLNSIYNKARPGLQDLLFKLDLAGRKLTSTEISWQLCPVINSAGRLGRANVCANLLMEQDTLMRDKLAEEIINMNDERKQLGEAAWEIAEPCAKKYMDQMGGNLAFAYGADIPRGATGITANRLSNKYKVPSLVISFYAGSATGSLRSARGYDLQALLDQLSDLFLDYGGHGFAAGFSMEQAKWDTFLERLELAAKTIEFHDDSEEKDVLFIDAELPLSYLNRDIFKVIDRLEPYGKDNRDIMFLCKGLKIVDITFIGKLEAKHVKLVLDAGSFRWAALYWNAAEKVKVDFDKNDTVDIVFHLERNWFKGSCTDQICIADLKRSS